ncbi:three-helix bundle dimerization domain-containing protein [Cryobacterium sp. AP23]
MSELDETQAIDQVIDRLSQRFPSLEREHIADVVQDEHGQLDEGRVRDFVPVLVEKAAKRRLKKEAKESRTPVEQPEALAPLPDGGPDLDPMEVERASREAQGSHLFNGVLGSSGQNER